MKIQISQLQPIAATLQSLALTGAVIVGGAWTWYTFRANRQADTAQAQFQKLKHEIETEPRIEIDISITPLKVPGADRRYILGSIHTKNVGSANTVLQLDREPIQIYQVTVGRNGEVWLPVRSPELKIAPTVSTPSLICEVGITKQVHFVAMIEDAGLYVVTFSAVRNAAESTAAKSLGAVVHGPKGRYEWQAQHYFVVE
ncbi:MAG: hypothetical protein JO231_16950 [Acidobacteria bacterium]|nr:hypothetical protein [Acidobacteriota bacterium]